MSNEHTEAHQPVQAAEPLALRLTDLLGPLPKAAAGYMQGCNQDLKEGDLLFTASQMRAYATEQVIAARNRYAALCRRVAEETRNSEDARAAGRVLANWIGTGDPNDPGA